MTDVSIIIPVKNGERYLKQVLSSIFLQITDLNYEVIVIDSGSSDRSLEIISGFPVRLIKIAPRDFGHGKTRNYGASFAKGKIIVFITQDAVPKGRYWLSNLIKTYSMDEKLAGVYCRQIPRPFENPVSVEGIRNWIAGKDEFKITEISSEAEYNRLSSLEKRLLINFDNVASSMKKSVWEQFRLPEATFAADHQWAKNVLLNGYKIAFQPESTVVHSHDRNAAYEFKRRFIDHKINYQQYNLSLFPTIKSLYFGILGDIKNKTKIILKSDFNLIFKSYFLVKNIFVSTAQDFGTYLGAKWEKESKAEASKIFSFLEKKIIQGV